MIMATFKKPLGRSRRSRSTGIAVAGTLLGALSLALPIAQPASARTLLYSLVGSNIQTASDGSAHTIVFEDGQTSIDFVLFEPATVAFYFSSECTVGALDSISWLDVDIRVDGVAQAPTSDDNAFCTSKNVLGTSGRWISASADAAGTFAAGTHTVDIQAALTGWSAGESWRLAEKTLVILIAEDD